jgi:DNA-3-methyladenine glycosylase II
MIKLYKLDTSNRKQLKEKMIQISNKWSPYKTYACLHLWKWKDEK